MDPSQIGQQQQLNSRLCVPQQPGHQVFASSSSPIGHGGHQQSQSALQHQQQGILITPEIVAFRNANAHFENLYGAAVHDAQGARDQLQHARKEHQEKEARWRNEIHRVTQISKGWQAGSEANQQEIERLKKEVLDLGTQHTSDLTKLRLDHSKQQSTDKATISKLQSEHQILQNELSKQQTANRALEVKVQKQKAMAHVQCKTANAVAARSVLQIASLQNQVDALTTKSRQSCALSTGLFMEVTRLEGSLDVALDVANDFAQKEEAAQTKMAGLHTHVDKLKTSLKDITTRNDNLQAAFDLKDERCSALETQLKTSEANHAKEKAVLKDCNKKRDVEQKENVRLAREVKLLERQKADLEEIVEKQKTTIRKDNGELLKKGNEIKDLTGKCSLLRKTAEEDNKNSVKLHQDKVAAEKAIGKLKQEKIDLQTQLDEMRQDLENARYAQEQAEDSHRAARQKLEAWEKLQQDEEEFKERIEERRKRLRNDDGGEALPEKKVRLSSEMTPPKSPTTSTNPKLGLQTPTEPSPRSCASSFVQSRKPSHRHGRPGSVSRPPTPKGPRYQGR